jgi:outer membrane protein
MNRIVACSLFALLIPTVAAGQSSPERLSLETALRLAVEHNRQIQSARLQVEKAEDELAMARMRRLPVFDTEVSAAQLLTPVGFSFPQGAFGDFPGTGPIPSVDTTVKVPMQPTMYVSSQVSQPISQLFRIGLGIKSAAASRDIERERARAQQLSTINSVKRLYFGILQTGSALTENAETIALYRELDRTLQVRVAQKVALRADALDVQYQLAREELTRTVHQNTLASQKEQLNQLLGRDVSQPFDVEDVSTISTLEIDLAAARGHALENRPDLREARLTLQQADLDRRVAKANRIPEVSLALSYSSNVNIDMLPTNLASFGVQVKWEPFDWGRKSRELAAKTRTVAQAQLAVRDAEDRAAVEVNSRFRTLTEKRALLAVARMAQNATRERLRVRTTQYQVQAALLPDVLQLRAELAETDDHYQQALVAFWTARADFELATGEEVIR